MTDSTHLALLPALMNRLSAVAPSIQVEITHISNETPKMLESGDADLAVGYMPALEAGFYQQKLFDQNFACVVQREHPRVRSRLTRQAFRRERHALVPAAGTGHELVERELERLGVSRRIVLRLPNLLGIGALVASTDLMITVPQRVADTLLRIADVKLFAPPFEFPSIAIKQHQLRVELDLPQRLPRATSIDRFTIAAVEFDWRSFCSCSWRCTREMR